MNLGKYCGIFLFFFSSILIQAVQITFVNDEEAKNYDNNQISTLIKENKIGSFSLVSDFCEGTCYENIAQSNMVEVQIDGTVLIKIPLKSALFPILKILLISNVVFKAESVSSSHVSSRVARILKNPMYKQINTPQLLIELIFELHKMLLPSTFTRGVVKRFIGITQGMDVDFSECDKPRSFLKLIVSPYFLKTGIYPTLPSHFKPIGFSIERINSANLLKPKYINRSLNLSNQHINALKGFKPQHWWRCADNFVKPSEIMVLDLSNNLFKTVHIDDIFTECPYIKVLSLAHNRLINITVNLASNKLYNLTKLYLANNNFKSIPAGLLRSLPVLMEIALHGNPLETLAEDSFNNNRDIKCLTLTYVGRTMPDILFHENTRLKQLDLEIPQVKRLPESILRLARLKYLSLVASSISDRRLKRLPYYIRQAIIAAQVIVK